MVTLAVPDRILVVDDDPTVTEVVVRYLEHDGFAVDAVANGLDAVAHADEAMPALVVLDIMLPGLDGLEVCRQLPRRAPVPVIMLTARGDEQDRVAGLELGADDYLGKPFSPRELLARVHAVLRRASVPLAAAPTGTIEVGDLRIDLAARIVEVLRRHGDSHRARVRPARVPRRTPGAGVAREDLLEDVWGYTYGDTATVTVHIRRLREKIERDPSAPRHLMTVWGVGYRLDP